RAVRNLLASATEEEPRNSAGLTAAEREVVAELRRRDREVRDHEEAHARVGGQYASQPSYEFEVGPDGRRYAVGGQVQIDVAPVKDDPEATIAKMEIVKAAALAPAEPSPADRQVAALADAQRLAAIVELSAQRSERRGFSSDEIQSLVSGLFKQTDEPIEPQFSAAA
ncbi:MAG: putative metalloprotease CJM1_0395 family protein, partial [Pseudomonadota bacterium]